jgi:predicted PurR-regulated permease PerM
VAILGVGFLLISRGLVLIADLPAVAAGGALHPVAMRASKLIGTLHITPGDPLSRLQEGVGCLAYHTAGLATGVAQGIGFVLLTLLFLGLAIYYVLLNWPGMVTRAERGLPFQPIHTRALFAEFRYVGRQILFGTVSIGLIQGVLAGLGCWATGVPEATFLGALTVVASLLPGLGATLVWLPVGIFQIVTGHLWAGLVEIAYGALVMELSINYGIRPRQVGRADLPGIFTFIALLGGVAVFGLIGLIVGPVVVSLCMAILKIYDDELLSEMLVAEVRGGPAPS